MFHWRTYTWESLGCIQLLVNSLPRSSGCKQNQPKKNKTFSKLSWPRTGLNPELQMAVSMSVRLQREAHLPSQIFKDGFHLAEGSFWMDNNYCSPGLQGFGDTWHRDPFQCCPQCFIPFAAVHAFEWVSGQEYLGSGGLLAWKSQMKESQEHHSKTISQGHPFIWETCHMPVEIIHLVLVDRLSAEIVLSSTLHQKKMWAMSSGVKTTAWV